MEMNNQIIEVLEYMGEKMGIAIDWTSQNILPYIQELCAKFVKWEISTSVAWIIIAILVAGMFWILAKVVDWDGDFMVITLLVTILAIVIVSVQAFDIIECCIFPEKAIYDYISTHMK